MLYHALAGEFRLERVILEGPVPRVEFLRRRFRRYGLLTVVGQALFVVLAVPVLRVAARRRIEEIERLYDLRDEPIPAERILRVASANSQACIRALVNLRPSLVVINGTRILSREVLESLPAPFVNVHAGITPSYRGVHGGYWALVEQDAERCGVTVHRVDTGIDTGPVIAQARIEPTDKDNFMSYSLLQLGAAIPLLRTAIREGAASEFRKDSPEPSRLWSHPTLWGYLATRWRCGVR